MHGCIHSRTERTKLKHEAQEEQVQLLLTPEEDSSDSDASQLYESQEDLSSSSAFDDEADYAV